MRGVGRGAWGEVRSSIKPTISSARRPSCVYVYTNENYAIKDGEMRVLDARD